MSDNENYKVQVSLSAPPPAQYAKGAMANFRGNDVSEVVQQLQEAQAAGLLELASEVEAVWTAAAGLNARTETVQPAQSATVTQTQSAPFTPAPAAGAPDVPAPSCPHGPRRWLAKGDWQAWACNGPRGQQCVKPNGLLYANPDGTLKGH